MGVGPKTGLHIAVLRASTGDTDSNSLFTHRLCLAPSTWLCACFRAQSARMLGFTVLMVLLQVSKVVAVCVILRKPASKLALPVLGPGGIQVAEMVRRQATYTVTLHTVAGEVSSA